MEMTMVATIMATAVSSFDVTNEEEEWTGGDRMGRFLDTRISALGICLAGRAIVLERHFSADHQPLRGTGGAFGQHGSSCRSGSCSSCPGRTKSDRTVEIISGRTGILDIGKRRRPASPDRTGTISLLFALLWIPVAAVLAATIWIKINATQTLKKQKELDQCVYEQLLRRCDRIVKLSTLNASIKKDIDTILWLEGVKNAARLVPGGQPAAVAAENTQTFLRQKIDLTAIRQEFILRQEQIESIKNMSLCGKPDAFIQQASIPWMSRTPDKKSIAAQSRASLTWDNHTLGGEISFVKDRLQSYGHCKTEMPETHPLSGEDYQIVMRHTTAALAKSFGSSWPR